LDRLLNTPSLEEKIEYVKKEPESLQDEHMNQLALQLLPELIKNPDSLTKIVEVSEQLKSMK